MTDSRAFEHALMNHLAVILGFSELLLQESPPDDPRLGDLAEILKAVKAAIQLVSARGDAAAGVVTAAVQETRPDDLDAMERDHIARVLGDVDGNKLAAARRLGISRRTLYRRLQRHGLMGPEREPGA
jgi:transcriptional regulator of acetoin/glycerol metabolism